MHKIIGFTIPDFTGLYLHLFSYFVSLFQHSPHTCCSFRSFILISKQYFHKAFSSFSRECKFCFFYRHIKKNYGGRGGTRTHTSFGQQLLRLSWLPITSHARMATRMGIEPMIFWSTIRCINRYANEPNTIFMVGWAGIEPARPLQSRGFKPLVSTKFHHQPIKKSYLVFRKIRLYSLYFE